MNIDEKIEKGCGCVYVSRVKLHIDQLFAKNSFFEIDELQIEHFWNLSFVYKNVFVYSHTHTEGCTNRE